MTAPKPPHRTTRWTPAQQKALKAWEKKHPFPNDFAQWKKKHPFHKGPQPRSRRPAPGTLYPGYPMVPVRGGGRGGGRHGGGRHGLAQPGSLPLCASLAVAESLLAATGTATREDDLLRLHEVAGGTGDGASLARVLAVLERRGLAGIQPLSVAEVFPGEGTVVSLRLEMAQADQESWDFDSSPFWGLHAALLADDHLITWGRAVPVTAAFLERQALAAWRITWPDKRGEGSVWRSPT